MRRFALLVLVLIGFDFATKSWAAGQGLLVFNQGISFGLFAAYPQLVLMGSVVAFGCLLYWQGREFLENHLFASSLFLAGAIANFTDRVLYGAVRDWMPVFGWWQLKNNLADWYIVVGVLLVLIKLWREEWHKRGTIQSQ